MRLALFLALLFAPACRGPALTRQAFAQGAMGTEFRIVLYAPDEASARAAAEAAFARIAALDSALSDYRAESELSRFARSSDGPLAGPWVPLSPELFAVLAASAEVARASAGAFDVTVGPLVLLWRRARRQEELPSAEALAAARARVGFEALELDPARRAARLMRPGMRLDLGGIAKGYALDEARRVLAEHGLERVLIDGGGDLLAGAPPPGERGWKVAIAGLDSADPLEDRASAELELAHAALATSGDLERSFELGGRRFSHILDPRTGEALTERRLVSVRAPSGMEADAWATALSVLGPAGFEVFPRRPGWRARLACASADGVRVFESSTSTGALSCAGSAPTRALP